MQPSQERSIGRPSQDGPASATTSVSMSMGGGYGAGELSLLEALVIVTQNERLSPDVLKYPQDLIDGALASLAAQRRIVDVAIERHQERLRRKLGGFSADDDDDEGDYSLPGGGTEIQHLVTGASLQLPIQPHDILRLEMTRLEFLVSELLRVRLQKIHQLCHRIHYLSDAYTTLLSEKEAIMASKFCELYEDAVLQSAMGPVTMANAAQRGTTPKAAARQYFTPSLSDGAGLAGASPSASAPLSLSSQGPSSAGHNPLPVPDKRARVFVCALEDLGQVDVAPNVSTNVAEGETLLTPLDVFETALNQRKARLL